MTANKYEIVPGSKCESTGQAPLVWKYLEQGPKTVKEIVPLLDADPAFKTRQTTLRIAAYYVCVFKKAGLVREVSAVAKTDDVPVMQHD